jgi:hypothetical protein
MTSHFRFDGFEKNLMADGKFGISTCHNSAAFENFDLKLRTEANT